MDLRRWQRITANRTGKKFGSHKTLYSKYTPQVPQSADREYAKLANAYMRLLKEELETELPKLKEDYKRNRDEDKKLNQRNDGYTDMMLRINKLFADMKEHLASKTNGFGLRRKLETLAQLNRKLTVKEWKKAIKATLGIDIREDYYLGDFYAEQLEQWVNYNIDLISTIPSGTLDKMRDMVFNGYAKGETTTQMVKDIQRVYRISKDHASLIARDQTAKLNGQIQQYQQQDAGITQYIWTTTGDERVRESHRELNGKIFNWSEPPVNSDGRACHPGEDYQCRCIGRPVFNKETLNLPIEDDDTVITIK